MARNLSPGVLSKLGGEEGPSIDFDLRLPDEDLREVGKGNRPPNKGTDSPNHEERSLYNWTGSWQASRSILDKKYAANKDYWQSQWEDFLDRDYGLEHLPVFMERMKKAGADPQLQKEIESAVGVPKEPSLDQDDEFDRTTG